MECLERCLYQVFRSDDAGSKFLRNGNTEGNCSVCSYDPENNKKCNPKYTPIKFWILEVVEEENK